MGADRRAMISSQVVPSPQDQANRRERERLMPDLHDERVGGDSGRLLFAFM